MKWLKTLLVLIARIVLAILGKRKKDSCVDGAKSPEIREKLKDKVVGKWGGKKLPVLLLCGLLVFAAGCVTTITHTIYVPTGEPVRLRETVKNVKVWVLDENGDPVAGRMDLPEGWYCLPKPEGEDIP